MYILGPCIKWAFVIYRLTPWSRILLQKLIVPHLVKKFPAFYGTQRFITVFTTACHLALSEPDESTPHSPNLCFFKIRGDSPIRAAGLQPVQKL
jgi:hypothetical protein